MRKRIRIQLRSAGPISLEQASFQVEIYQSISRILGQKWLTQGSDEAGHYWDVSISEDELASALLAITMLLEQNSLRDILPVLVEDRSDLLERIDSESQATIRTQAGRQTLLTNPPNYLKGRAIQAHDSVPARLLEDGNWCGHGEPKYAVFDVYAGKENIFSVQLPESDDEALNPSMVVVNSDSGVTFPIYDSRKHPASLYYIEDETESEESLLQSTFHCPSCDKQRFNISVGFEIPSDSSSPNDTSWFALAVKCVECEWEDIIFDDETA